MKRVLACLLLLVPLVAVAAAPSPGDELIRAASKGQTQTVRKLLEHGVPVNSVHKITGWTALTAASFYGFADTTKVLLGAGADPNHRDLHGGTPLMKAVTVGQSDDPDALISRKAEVVRLLLKGGADPQQKDNLGDSPWQAAMVTEQFALVDVFEEAGVPGVAEARLLYASAHHDSAKVKKLIAAHVNINYRDDLGWNAISAAVLADDVEMLRILIGGGADVNARYEKGWTPLLIAIANRHTAIARALLAAGADPSLATENGITALALAKQTGNQEVLVLLQ